MTCGPGPITHALFTIPETGAASGFPLMRRHIASMVRNLSGARKHIVIVCPPSFPDPTDWCLQEHGGTLSVLRAALPPEAFWVQDPLLVVKPSPIGRPRLILSAALRRYPAWMSSLSEVAEICNLDVGVVDFPFSGGNVLQGVGPALVGLDLIHRIANWTHTSIVHATELLRSLLGVSINPIGVASCASDDLPICRGIGFQPLFHLDLFVTRTGIAGKNGREIVFVAHPAKTKEVLGDFGNELTREWARRNPMQVCEQQLEAYFDVRRLPIMFVSGRLGSTWREERTYPLTFNNCVMDGSGAADARVLLPSFHQDSFLYDADVASRRVLEHAAAEMWRDLGVEVQFSDGVEDLAYYSGGLHCMLKVLRRAEPGVV